MMIDGEWVNDEIRADIEYLLLCLKVGRTPITRHTIYFALFFPFCLLIYSLSKRCRLFWTLVLGVGLIGIREVGYTLWLGQSLKSEPLLSAGVVIAFGVFAGYFLNFKREKRK
jgi:hypothetical protein